MASRYRGTHNVTTRATWWRGFRALGVIAIGGALVLLAGVLVWNLLQGI